MRVTAAAVFTITDKNGQQLRVNTLQLFRGYLELKSVLFFVVVFGMNHFFSPPTFFSSAESSFTAVEICVFADNSHAGCSHAPANPNASINFFV